MPFYKRENEELQVAPLFVSGPGFDLAAENRDDHEYPVEGWYWFDSLDAAMTALMSQPELTVEQQYTAALESHYDAVAQSRRYDNRLTCALRAGYPGPFQAEALAFAQWMDNCNELAYKVMVEVLSGRTEMPTIQELIDLLPAIQWPAQ